MKTKVLSVLACTSAHFGSAAEPGAPAFRSVILLRHAGGYRRAHGSNLGFREELQDALDRHGNVGNGADDFRRAVRRQIARGVDVIKFATTEGVNSRIGLGLGPQMFEDEARAIVETAHLYGKKVAVHAHSREGIIIALKAGADSIEHGTMRDEEAIGLLLKTGAYYVPTLSTIDGYLERLQRDPNAYEPGVGEKIEWRRPAPRKKSELPHVGRYE